MKDLEFLFNHFPFFLIVYAAVICDTVLSVGNALVKKTFDAKKFPEYLYKIVVYTVLLCFANLVEYFGGLTGYSLEFIGLLPTVLTILTREAKSIMQYFPDLTATKK